MHASKSLSYFPVRGDHTSPSILPLPRFSVALGGPLRSLLERGFLGAVHGLHVPSLAAPSPSLQLDLCYCFSCCFFYVTWVIVFCFGKLLYLKLCWYIFCPTILFLNLNSVFTVLAIFWWLL
jgi:hypothetical protein